MTESEALQLADQLVTALRFLFGISLLCVIVMAVEVFFDYLRSK